LKKGCIAFSALLHLLVVIGQVFGWVTRLSAQRFFKQVLTELVGISALLRIRTSLVFLLGAQLSGWWTVEPSFTCGGG